MIAAIRFLLPGALALCLLTSGARAEVAPPKPMGTADMAKALAPGPLPELSVGAASGVPVIEYGSVTCSHCAHFDKDVWPAFKTAYVDTGKARYIFREYSRNALDVAAFMVARCNGDDKALATIELLFAQQDQWAFVDKPLDGLVSVLRQAGLDRTQIMACLKDQAKANALAEIAKTADKEFAIQGTPTFIIGGKVYDGALSIDELNAIMKPLVTK